MAKRETRLERWEIDPNTPAGTSGVLVLTAQRRRGEWETGTTVTIDFTANRQSYDARIRIEAQHGPDRIFSSDTQVSVPRRLV